MERAFTHRRTALVAALILPVAFFAGRWLLGGVTPPDEPPIVVTRDGLVRAYRDSPRMADHIFKNRKVQLNLTNGTYVMPDYQLPVIQSAPDVKEPRRTTTTVGVCRGIEPSVEARGVNCFFVVVLEDCRHQ